MPFAGLSVISVFKCKRHYRSRVLRHIMEKAIDDELSIPMDEYKFLACFMYSPCSKLTNFHISAKVH